jgi:hypothetical protein
MIRDQRWVHKRVDALSALGHRKKGFTKNNQSFIGTYLLLTKIANPPSGFSKGTHKWARKA